MTPTWAVLIAALVIAAAALIFAILGAAYVRRATRHPANTGPQPGDLNHARRSNGNPRT
jgi:uncharacterized membrane protein